MLRARALNLLGRGGGGSGVQTLDDVEIDEETGFPMDRDGIVDLSVFEFEIL